MTDPLRKPEGISWNAASLELPEIPMLPAGQDALSATISAVLPTLAAPLAANVATLSAKENMFSGKLGAAQAAYQNSDDAGSQSVGQIVGMLGQVGQQAGQMGRCGTGASDRRADRDVRIADAAGHAGSQRWWGRAVIRRSGCRWRSRDDGCRNPGSGRRQSTAATARCWSRPRGANHRAAARTSAA